ncbi:MAG: hypothetical protein IT462_10280 [Planctomycetes bacterium]|nr:hypothetical protein [Planctomycetota bacterium]
MAKREPTRKIKLPPMPGAAPQRPVPAGQRPTGPQQRPAPASPRTSTGPIRDDDDVGQAMSNLDRNAQVRSRSELPDRVKVITPAVIQGIVHSIVDKFAGGVSAEQLTQLAAEQTQLQLKLQQAQGKVQTLQDQIYQLQAHNEDMRMQLENASAGAANADESAQYYMDQIRQLQQSNAKAVDTYMDVTRQLEEREAQLSESEAAGAHSAEEVIQLRDTLDQYAAEVERLRQVEASAGDAQQAVNDLGAEVDKMREENEKLQAQIEQMESSQAEQSEGANQEQSVREQAERDRDAAEGRITALEAELSQAREELAEARAAQDRVGELEVALADIRAQLDEERAKAKGELEGEGKKTAERVETLEKKNRDLSDQLKDANITVRKYENVSMELEKLRMAEGNWLEQKRQLASQLSHETNLRREADQKLKAIEKGEVVTGTAKLLDSAAKQAKAEADTLRKELEALKQEQAEDGKAGQEAEKLRKELDSAKKELAAANKLIEEAQGEMSEEAKKRIAELEAQVKNTDKNFESDKKDLLDQLEKAEAKARKFSEELKQANVTVRKFDNVSMELEKLRMAEGQWLEQKRQLASQLSHETDLRREADAKLKAIEKGEVKGKK